MHGIILTWDYGNDKGLLGVGGSAQKVSIFVADLGPGVKPHRGLLVDFDFAEGATTVVKKKSITNSSLSAGTVRHVGSAGWARIIAHGAGESKETSHRGPQSKDSPAFIVGDHVIFSDSPKSSDLGFTALKLPPGSLSKLGESSQSAIAWTVIVAVAVAVVVGLIALVVFLASLVPAFPGGDEGGDDGDRFGPAYSQLECQALRITALDNESPNSGEAAAEYEEFC